MSIVLVRVDHRLVHGQVTMGWTRTISAGVILIVNDRVAHDSFESNLLHMAVPSGVTLHTWSTDFAAGRITAGELPGERTMLLVATPTDLLPLFEAGLTATEVNIGGVRSPGARIKLTKEVHATDDELHAWKDLDARGIRLSVQWLPDQRRRRLNEEVQKR